jgi:hypothetical protein
VGSHLAHFDGVAIRISAHCPGRADGAAGSNDVLDDDLLAQGSRHVLANYAGRNIGRTAGGEGHNHGDRSGRKILRRCGFDAQARDGKSGDGEKRSRVHTIALCPMSPPWQRGPHQVFRRQSS